MRESLRALAFAVFTLVWFAAVFMLWVCWTLRDDWTVADNGHASLLMATIVATLLAIVISPFSLAPIRLAKRRFLKADNAPR
jgi:hypothetical protein